MNEEAYFFLISFKEVHEEKIVNNGIEAILEIFRCEVFNILIKLKEKQLKR